MRNIVHHRGVWVIVVVAGAVIGLAALLDFEESGEDVKKTVQTDEELKKLPNVVGKKTLPAIPAPDLGVKRIAVAGQEGYTIVIHKDGSSYLENAEGVKVRQLTEAGAIVPSEVVESVIKKIADTPLAKRPGLGQLVVCNKGVVDIPKDAVITFIGDDKVVTHNPNNTSTVYYVDGRVEHRGDVK